MSKEYTIIQASKLMNNSRQAVFGLVKKGRIEGERKGRRYLISDNALLEYCNLRLSELDQEKDNLLEIKHYLQ